MGLFIKKEMDCAAAETFWQWFAENEDRIIEALAVYDMDIVRALDDRLAPVFPYYKEELEFQLGFHEGEGEFIFFHLGERHLQQHSEALVSMMPRSLRERWRFTAED